MAPGTDIVLGGGIDPYWWGDSGSSDDKTSKIKLALPMR